MYTHVKYPKNIHTNDIQNYYNQINYTNIFRLIWSYFRLNFQLIYALISPYFRPNPSHSLIALIKRSLSFSILLYSGNNKVLKHVCDVGNNSESGPIL